MGHRLEEPNDEREEALNVKLRELLVQHTGQKDIRAVVTYWPAMEDGETDSITQLVSCDGMGTKGTADMMAALCAAVVNTGKECGLDLRVMEVKSLCEDIVDAIRGMGDLDHTGHTKQ